MPRMSLLPPHCPAPAELQTPRLLLTDSRETHLAASGPLHGCVPRLAHPHPPVLAPWHLR